MFRLNSDIVCFRESLESQSSMYSHINFESVAQKAALLARKIDDCLDQLIDVLLEYESYEVAIDEISRTLDVLNNLRENESYFRIRTGAVTSFLPRNQPLYALICFVIIPSLMATEVHFRIPQSAKNLLPKVIGILDLHGLFSNLVVSPKERMEFLRDRSALRVNPRTGESRPVTDAVIFTGTPGHANQLRLVFDRRVLFISNGAGHNPIIVARGADIDDAVDAALTLTLYNQGQDCAAPNAVLVHEAVYSQFMNRLYLQLKNVEVGPYSSRSCRVGPISNPDDLKFIQGFLLDNRKWLDVNTVGIVRTSEAIVEPTIICKPLTEGGNYEELYAPIVFVQVYVNDEDLALYFENSRYAQNAMYVTLFGESRYVKSLVGRIIEGKVLHFADTFLQDTHLHARGIERGTQPYGGYGHGASSISINGKITPMPTLPQRDIFEHVAKPLLRDGEAARLKLAEHSYVSIEQKNIEKLLKMRHSRVEPIEGDQNRRITFVDLAIVPQGIRYVEAIERASFHLLTEPNAEYITTLLAVEVEAIRALVQLLDRKPSVLFDAFSAEIYAIPKSPEVTNDENAVRQLKFFKSVYWLLFNKSSGPKLGVFLWEANVSVVRRLLDF